ncbi:uncharacterized protein LY89DRAFT_678416 [Mollisia scopiformis]|uniref:Uncharacterized protein n=1 Tax=Mollisia scopiformis TaxID=149040 RepID=A0A132B356_MOLSC|nr:uncharacterized protein LY89DRAFT_678416 [Mollisia scopiformis]KUJ06835.1 hypothetical protein LY89DRAFT_678416 [Mollisia scopiformis]
MKFSATLLSFLALAVASNALPQGLNQPIFSCAAPEFGGCCERFLADGTGVGCNKADVLINGADVQYTCNDAETDQGLPACCEQINTPPGTHIGILLPCQQTSAGY